MALTQTIFSSFISQISTTVISGVLVFSITQLIIHLWILPRQAYLKEASELSCVMLELLPKISNFSLPLEDITRIRNKNASYLSTKINSSPFYKKHTRKTAFEVAQNINGLIALSLQPFNKNNIRYYLEFTENIASLDKNVIINYSAPRRPKKKRGSNK